MRFTGSTPDRLLVAPIDLRVADSHIATEIYGGHFSLGGTRLVTEGLSPFQLPAPSQSFFEALHSFGWLRHMRAADHDLAAANARSLVDDWINHQGRHIGGPAYQPEILAPRLIAWLSHSPVVLRGADHGFYRRFLKSIALQMRVLRHVGRSTPDGAVRFKVRIALAMASLCLPCAPGPMKTAARQLDEEFERQILPDGGHVSRNPQVLLELLTDLLPLRQTYINVGVRPPLRMAPGIDRMFAALRFFRHSNGELALFNGATALSADTMMSVLRYDDTGGKPFREAPHSGFQRLTAGDSVVIADTGRPLQSRLAETPYAGCLAFEFSSGRSRLIVNAGGPLRAVRDHQQFARTTAAHSTLTLNDDSSLRYSRSRFLGPVMVGGIELVEVVNEDAADGSRGFTATHDGYRAAFGRLHRRTLRLSGDGTLLQGFDVLLEADGTALEAWDEEDEAAIRFHIHPKIKLSESEDGSILLTTPEGAQWQFSCDTVWPTIESDVHFADIAGARVSEQIVLAFTKDAYSGIEWQLARIVAEPTTRRSRLSGNS
ncbi:heparinase II/III family protein [Pseudohoeflea sp. DP4N28-3]|uniref:Heparinase II/III family protein n=2 Tax=Pseudohoeflea coraliihabitans TaxID=2860393 RepID=A0ABS6WT64_9HYPH|nr:heparinase II/III family protein [Pseudohoeflea sp. DP4N28-3]MBW3099157.1 heparinase II/III family protein [Pseudohoeflea sp. DP4N28-3]